MRTLVKYHIGTTRAKQNYHVCLEAGGKKSMQQVMALECMRQLGSGIILKQGIVVIFSFVVTLIVEVFFGLSICSTIGKHSGPIFLFEKCFQKVSLR